MKIQNELLGGIVSNEEQLEKTGSAQLETDFAALLAEELAQGQQKDGVLAAIKEIVPLASLDGLEKSQPAAGFSPEEDKFMDEVSELLGMVDSYGAALAGEGNEQAQANLKSVYSLLEAIGGKTEQLKGELAQVGNNPVLSGILDELEVMAATEKFKLNRGDYAV